MNAEDKRNLIQKMVDNGEFDYGATMPKVALLASFGVEKTQDSDLANLSIPQVRKVIQREALEEVDIITFVRKGLMDFGRYLDVNGDTVRVALPSENKEFIRRYQDAAKRKLSMAQRLLQATDPTHLGPQDNAAIRQLRQQDSLKRQQRRH